MVNVFIVHLGVTTCWGNLSANFFPSEKWGSSKSKGSTTQTAAKHCNDPALAVFFDHFFRWDSSRLSLSMMPRAGWAQGAPGWPTPSSAPTDTHSCVLAVSIPSNTGTTAAFQRRPSTSFQHSSTIMFLGLTGPMEAGVGDRRATAGGRGWGSSP